MNVVIMSRIDDPGALDYTRELAHQLASTGDSVQFEARTAGALGVAGADPSAWTGDVAVVVGGDGSVLLAVQRMTTQIPVIGINWGEVGFLTELEPEEAPAFLERVRSEGYRTESRMRISLDVNGKPIGDALNEAVIVTQRPAKMLRFCIGIDGVITERFRADGLLVSTPTGSTAYAMSAGGPIVDPRIEGFLIVPLAPYLLSSRPHLISDERNLEIKLECEKTARLVLDGQYTTELTAGSILHISKASQPAIFVDAGKNFFLKVESKLRRL
ncbi:MAG: NAD(+)/NADH kinase [Methanomicrobiaceae archaeon]|nr:NAD(+)/NADH kinase [Methanomicrobiaceae archaeon]